MDKVKRVILLAVPMSICNFRCSYCYLTHRMEYFQGRQPQYRYPPEHVGKALSRERLGGAVFINICADGETLLARDIDKYTHELLKQGHYVEFVTNLTITPVLKKILAWDKELLKHLVFKCSFHYLQLKKRNLLDVFAGNVKRIWEAGGSANIEITPSDDLIPYIEEVKSFSLRQFGALPHLTIARNDRTENIGYLTSLPIAEYDRVWGQFDSDFWKFKKAIFGQKRNEFCYAGDWSLHVNLETGAARECYIGRHRQNIFEDIAKPIRFKAMGHCLQPHCYNGHALLAFGCIPRLTDVRYGDIRNRIRQDGGGWLQPELQSFFNSSLAESNAEYPEQRKRRIRMEAALYDKTYGMAKWVYRKLKK